MLLTDFSSHSQVKRRHYFKKKPVDSGVMSLYLFGSRLLWTLLLMLATWTITLAIFFAVNFIFTTSTRKPNASVFFAAFHEKIRKVFRQQRGETLAVLAMGVNRVMRRGSGENSVLTLLAAEGALKTANYLATLLVHCVLIGYQRPAGYNEVKALMVDGTKYTSDDDEFHFFRKVRRMLRSHGVAAVLAAERLHPHVMRTLHLLATYTYSPCFQSVIVVVVDVQRRFTKHQLMTENVNTLGETCLEQLLSAHLDMSERAELIQLLSARCVLVLPERHIPTV